MGERGAFGVARRTRSELDIDGLVSLERRAERGQRIHLRIRGLRQQLVEIVHAGSLVRAEADDELQRGQFGRLQRAGLGRSQFRREVAEHFDVIRCLERGREDDGAATDLVDRIFELGATIGGVDIDQNETCLGGRVLRQQPFDIVLRPDGDTVALLEPQAPQRTGDCVDAALEFGVGETVVLMARHERFARRVFCAGRVEIGADRLFDQRNAGRALVVTELGHGRFLEMFFYPTLSPARIRPARRHR